MLTPSFMPSLELVGLVDYYPFITLSSIEKKMNRKITIYLRMSLNCFLFFGSLPCPNSLQWEGVKIKITVTPKEMSNWLLFKHLRVKVVRSWTVFNLFYSKIREIGKVYSLEAYLFIFSPSALKRPMCCLHTRFNEIYL